MTAAAATLKKKRSSGARGGAGRSRSTITVRCGSVTVELVRPSQAEVRRNIAAGQKALSGVKDAFLKPGIRLRAGKGIPLYSVDPKNPAILVRVLNGKKARGVLKDGAFSEVSK